MKNQLYDKIIIGAGFYGLYSAAFCGAKGQKVLVLEREDAPFKRATYINQARVHQGYHYPRSLSTAMKSAGYFAKFSKDFDFCINKEFEKIYAVSSDFSWTNRDQFMNFCKAADIPCTELNPKNYFKDELCDGAFLTREYTYDAHILRDYYLEKLKEMPSVTLMFNAQITAIEHDSENYTVTLEDSSSYTAPFVLNATYASVNQVSELAGFDDFKIKYELCEIILCDANEELKKYGFTMMDGPFFSIMPFGKTGYHSLTSVTFTPHSTSYDATPTFTCQKYAGGDDCLEKSLANCNSCPAKPATAFPYMANLARKYLLDKYQFTYNHSLFSMKPILMSSEVDDSRPTLIRKMSDKPVFISVLSGKINTVYDLEEFLI